MRSFLRFISIIAIVYSYAFSQAFAQEEEEFPYALYGVVGDFVTHKTILGVKAELLSTDSVCLFEYNNGNPNQYVGDIQAPFLLILKNPGKYILRFSKDGYETRCINWEIKKFHKKEKSILHAPVYLKRKRKEQKLGEAVVVATKVKFYNKGDTLVFNADAFQLQEGSMLDALIRQLPGVELKDDGRIFVNGKYVESLLLNGENFFSKDRNIMLENLPTYMVKTVNVYKKDGKMSEMMGMRMGDEQYVMDVRLKKQYSIGWIGNAEVAGGTEDRYLARLFALRFTDHSRLSFFGAMNNVNEYVKPGQGREWVPSVGNGLTTTRHGGVDYLINDRNKRFKLEGSAEVRHSDDSFDQRSASENFLEGGNTYGLSTYRNRTHNFSIISNHSFDFSWNYLKLNVRPSFSYIKTDQNTQSKSGTFSINPENFLLTAETLDSLFQPNVSVNLLAKTLNRQSAESAYSGHALTTGANAQAVVSFPHNTSDRLLFEARGSFTDNEYENFAHRFYDYPSGGNQSSQRDFRNEYVTTPYRAHSYGGKAAYVTVNSKNWQFQPYYEYGFSQARQRKALMRLDRIDGWGDGTGYPLGMLPSVADWAMTALDGPNSPDAESKDDYHTIGLYIHKEPLMEDYWRWTFSLPLSFDRSRLSYVRPEMVDTALTRHKIFFRPSIQGGNTWYVKAEDGHITVTHELSFGYSLTANAPNLGYSVRLRDDSDPLNIRDFGRQELKDIWSHNLNAAYNWRQSDKQRLFGFNWTYSYTQNALAMGYVYDRATGKRTYSPDNVNGNWNTGGGLSYSMPIDRKRKLTMNLNTSANYNHSVDLIGTEGKALRSTVDNLYLSQGLRFDYRISTKYQIGVKGNGTWTHASSQRPDFETIDAADFSYGLTAQIELPWQLQLSTDFTVYSRRGYEEQTMNTDDIVWNARLAKRLFKGRLSVMLDGFDLLGQLSNIRRTLNGQGRVETWHNTIPRYAMLHLVYRLNVQPKKK